MYGGSALSAFPLGTGVEVVAPYSPPSYAPQVMQSVLSIHDNNNGLFSYNLDNPITAGNMLVMFQSIIGDPHYLFFTPDGWTQVANIGYDSNDYETTTGIYVKIAGDDEPQAFQAGPNTPGAITLCVEVAGVDPDLTKSVWTAHQGYAGQFDNSGVIQKGDATYIVYQVVGDHRIGDPNPPYSDSHCASDYLTTFEGPITQPSCSRCAWAALVTNLPIEQDLNPIVSPTSDFHSFYGVVQLVAPPYVPPFVPTAVSNVTITGGFRIAPLWAFPLLIQRGLP